MNELLIAVIGTLIAALLVYEVQAWFPRICDGLIELALRRLPKRQRPRYAEEWRGHIVQVPGAVMKIWHALGFVAGAGYMFPLWQRRITYRRTVTRAIFVNRLTIRLLDLAIVVPSLVILAPILTSVANINAFTGPALHRIRVYSPTGSYVSALKFRTMRADEMGGLQVTGLGRFLRKTGLDMLPQLFSVFSGKLSLITAEKPGIIPAEFAHPDFKARQSITRMSVAYTKTVWCAYLRLCTGRI